MTESHSTIGKYYTILVICFTTPRPNTSSMYYAPCIAHPCFILSTLPPRLQSEWITPACLAASAMGMFPLKSSDPTTTFVKQKKTHNFIFFLLHTYSTVTGSVKKTSEEFQDLFLRKLRYFAKQASIWCSSLSERSKGQCLDLLQRFLEIFLKVSFEDCIVFASPYIIDSTMFRQIFFGDINYPRLV